MGSFMSEECGDLCARVVVLESNQFKQIFPPIRARVSSLVQSELVFPLLTNQVLQHPWFTKFGGSDKSVKIAPGVSTNTYIHIDFI